MRKSLHDMELTERWFNQQLGEEERQQFSLRLLTDASFFEEVEWQHRSYRLIRLMARQKLKATLENMHSLLMQDPAFNQEVQQIFS